MNLLKVLKIKTLSIVDSQLSAFLLGVPSILLAVVSVPTRSCQHFYSVFQASCSLLSVFLLGVTSRLLAVTSAVTRYFK